MDTNLNSAKQSARTGLIVCEKCGATILFDDISTDLLEACGAALDWLNRFGEHAPIVAGGEAELAELLRRAIARAKGKEAEVPV